MTGMTTLGLVALREIVERGRSKAYLATTAVTVLIILATIVLPTVLGGGPEEATIGSVGAGNEEIIETALRLANANDESEEAPSLEIETIEYDSSEGADSALVDGVVDLVLVDGSRLVVANSAGLSGSSLVDRIQRAAATVEIERIVAEEGQGAADVIDLLTSDPLDAVTVTYKRRVTAIHDDNIP